MHIRFGLHLITPACVPQAYCTLHATCTLECIAPCSRVSCNTHFVAQVLMMVASLLRSWQWARNGVLGYLLVPVAEFLSMRYMVSHVGSFRLPVAVWGFSY